MMPPISTILIVDDSKTHRLHAEDLCQQCGAEEIRQAENGEQGLLRMREALPDLVLLDLEMPKLDGIQVLQQMAKEGLNPPVIVTSGKDYMLISSVEIMGHELGLTILGGLKKPLSFENLSDLIARLGHGKTDDHAVASTFSDVDVRRALDQGEIVPFYQPKMSLNDNQLKGAEMLARWNHPEQGIVSPAQFIPIIEQSGWITELTLKLLQVGLRQWQEWARIGLRIPLSVNLSALSLQGETLVPAIEACIRTSRVPARFAIFEITETAVAENLAEAIGIAVRLRLSGVGLSIDDFGTGFATLQQLTRFPFTELKIDQSLVTSMANKPHMEAILNSVIELARRMQLTTVAEGIETEEDLHFISSHGCTLGQGYLFSRPLDATAFEAWVKSHKPTARMTLPQN